MFEIEEYFRNFFDIGEPIAKPLWVFQYDEMSVHTQGKAPEKLINERRPYEDEAIKEYRIKSYEPITKAPVTRAIDQISRTFNNANVTIQMDAKLQAYIDQPIFKGLKLLPYINQNVTRRMIDDPNGVLFWWIDTNSVGTLNSRIEVKPILVLTKNIMHFDDEVFSFISAEKSDVLVSKRGKLVIEKSGDVYYVATKNEYWKYIQVGEKRKKEFQAELIYSHNLDMLPCVVLKGYEVIEPDEKTNDDIHYYTSFFSSFTAYANETIRQFSDHQGIMTVSGFPLREMEPIECPAEKCQGGHIYDDERNRKPCNVCDGKGTIVPSSPYGVLIRPLKKSVSDTTEERPMLQYITPPVDILKYSGDYWKALLSEAEKSLNLLFIEEAQSGVAKEIDREVLLSTLDAIGINIYENIIRTSLIIIAKLRGYSSENIIINLPPSFKIKSEKEMSEEITTYNEKGAPDIVMIESTRAFLKKKFAGDKNLQKMCDLLFLIDPYFHYDINTKTTMLAAGAITDEEFQKSLNVLNVSMRIFKKYGDNVQNIPDDTLMTEIETELEKVIKTKIPEKEPMFDPMGNPIKQNGKFNS